MKERRKKVGKRARRKGVHKGKQLLCTCMHSYLISHILYMYILKHLQVVVIQEEGSEVSEFPELRAEVLDGSSDLQLCPLVSLLLLWSLLPPHCHRPCHYYHNGNTISHDHSLLCCCVHVHLYIGEGVALGCNGLPLCICSVLWSIYYCDNFLAKIASISEKACAVNVDESHHGQFYMHMDRGGQECMG